MKKFLILLGCLLLLTGCGKRLENEKQVNKYLKERYASEKFEILGKEVEEEEMEDACGDGTVKLSVWKVHSKSEDIDFTVRETYKFNSFVCEYGRSSTYSIDVVKNLYPEWDYEYGSFTYQAGTSSKDEIANYIYEAFTKISEHNPFKNDSNTDFALKVIYSGGEVNLRYKSINSVEDVKSKLEK